jgi:hypothetical protein
MRKEKDICFARIEGKLQKITVVDEIPSLWGGVLLRVRANKKEYALSPESVIHKTK